jgi:hypothetical protein
MAEAEFQWGDLGEEWWTTAGKEIGASPEQIKFAAARHQGATATAAARSAGYSGTANTIRQAAYRALRTTAVTNMLALAAAEGDLGGGGITEEEVDAKLARMIRAPDSTTAIRAIEAREKREATRRADRAAAQAADLDPDQLMAEMEAISPEAAAFIRQGAEWKGLSAHERGLLEARRWLAENPDAARQFLRELSRPNDATSTNN